MQSALGFRFHINSKHRGVTRTDLPRYQIQDLPAGFYADGGHISLKMVGKKSARSEAFFERLVSHFATSRVYVLAWLSKFPVGTAPICSVLPVSDSESLPPMADSSACFFWFPSGGAPASLAAVAASRV